MMAPASPAWFRSTRPRSSYDALPPELVELIKQIVLDTLGRGDRRQRARA